MSNVRLITDNSRKLKSALESLTDTALLVGVPSEYNLNHRTDSDMLNANLGYMFEFGEPSAGVPQRSFLIPGVKNAIPDTAHLLAIGAKNVLDLSGDPSKELEQSFQIVGEYCVQRVQDYIDEISLYDTGQLSQSMTYKLVPAKDIEK